MRAAYAMFGGELRVSHEAKDDTLLVIGVHREELAFGERVAAVLAERADLSGLELLRIPDGISGRHPRSDQLYRYELQHRAIYRQIHEVAGRHRLLIDLHQGADDAGPCADIICASSRLLECMNAQRARVSRQNSVSYWDQVRTVQLTAHGQAAAPGAISARTVIPRDVWNSRNLLFVGLEVYLSAADVGRPEDWRFAARIITSIIECAQCIDPGSVRSG